jgi:hypothetical protein
VVGATVFGFDIAMDLTVLMDKGDAARCVLHDTPYLRHFQLGRKINREVGHLRLYYRRPEAININVKIHITQLHIDEIQRQVNEITMPQYVDDVPMGTFLAENINSAKFVLNVLDGDSAEYTNYFPSEGLPSVPSIGDMYFAGSLVAELKGKVSGGGKGYVPNGPLQRRHGRSREYGRFLDRFQRARLDEAQVEARSPLIRPYLP